MNAVAKGTSGRGIRAVAVRHLTALALVVLGSSLSAQRFYFDNVGVAQGLPASKVYAVLEDVQGRIWIGTDAGLARYDGIQVESFGPNQGVAPNGVRSLFQDSKGRIWAGHLGGGISLFEEDRSRVVRPSGKALNSDITGLAEDLDGHLWISTFGEGALQVRNVGEAEELEVQRFDKEINERIAGITRLKNGTLCFLEANGSVRALDHGSDSFTPFPLKGLPEGQRVTALYEHSSGALWVGTFTGGAFRLDPSKGTIRSFDITTGLPSNFIFSFSEDAQGNTWIGTWDGGVVRMEKDGFRVFRLEDGLHGISIRCMIRDREGNMLLGTNENGLDIFKGEHFVSFTEADGLVDPQVWAVMEDRQGRMWFGTNGGISILDLDEHSTARVRNMTMQQGQLTSNRVRCLKEDPRGNVYIGTENGGLFEFDPRTFRFRYDNEVSGSIPGNTVTALEVGNDGEMWVGTIKGLIRFKPGGVPSMFREEDGLAGNSVVAIYRDAQGVIWVGSTLRGITRIANGVPQAVDIGRSFTATCFVQDHDGRLWVGTEGQGLLALEKDKLVAAYTIDDGLLSNVIKSLNVDGKGHVWVGTNRGLNEWRKATNNFTAYTERAGFTGIEAKANATCVTRKWDIWFGTAHGATRVSTSSRVVASLPLPVFFRGLRVNLEARPLEHGVTFDHTERNIRIAYGSVSLSDPGAVQYRYKLEGLEADWQPVTTETDAHYPGLVPGKYTFKVEAMNRAGEWSEAPASYAFTILPPWYKSWWFYTLLVSAIAIMLFSYIKVREKQLRARNLLLEQKVQERTAEVVAQSKEIEGQKVEIEGLLLNILPREISEELKVNGKATARRHDEVSVLFTDMKGFTKAAEKMTPEELVYELDECFIGFDEITARFGIEKIKTIGDSYMCACGVPSRDPHHAVKSVLAAMEVRELMDKWRREREAAGKEPWILRIGIHSGPVVAGVVGKRKFAYDIWGDTVNTASRMESSGVPGEVNISGTTYGLIKEYFECEHRGQVEAKNKGAIDMYFVRRLKPAYSADKNGTRASAAFLAQLGVAVGQEELA
jgi:ligand-binding sensor domain-containing protein/class 3 adenylate cyclase